jgi:phosphatidylinositol glycan class B
MSSIPARVPRAAHGAAAPRMDAIWWRLISVVVLAASALRLWLALHDHSIYWPDEIYQSLEPAHRLAFGTGFIPWEFRDGARSWLLPGLIAGLWRLAASFGVHSSLTLVAIARACVVLASAASLWLSARLSARLSSARAGFVAVLVLAVLPASLVFSYRTMSESLSAPLIVLSALWLLDGVPRRTCAAAVCITLATLLRYQNALFGLVFLLWLGGERRRREVMLYFGTGVATLVAGGLLDWITWGRPFHSLIAYVDFNLLRGGASTFGVEPVWYYARTLWDGTGPAILLFALLALLGGRRVPGLGLAVLSFLLVHSFIPHKELRFLMPALPLGCVLVGLGADELLRHSGRYARWCWIGLGAAALATALALPDLNYRRMGQYRDTPRGLRSVWYSDEEANLLLASAGEQPDLCGLGVLGLRPAFTGGYTYLHRAVPLLYSKRLCGAEPAVNYLIVPYQLVESLVPAGYTRVEDRGWLGLFRREGACAALPSAFDPLLEGAHDMGLYRPVAEQAQDGSVHFDVLRHSGSFVKGWGMGELIECLPGRWVDGQRGLVQFRASAPDRAYVLRARLRAYETAKDQQLKLSLNGQGVYEGALPTTSQLITADLPALRRGRNELAFELSRVGKPGGDDVRQLSALLESLDIDPLVNDFDFAIGTSADDEHLLSGFSTPEGDGRQHFVWNDGPVSVVQGYLDAPESPHVLSFTAQALPGVSGRARLSVNDHLLGMVELAPDWRSSELLVPPEFLRLGKNRVSFEYEATIIPAALNADSTDQRQLAARFRSFALTALPERTVLDLGTPEARTALLEGWGDDEQEGERSALWSLGARSRLSVLLGGLHDARLTIEARAYPPALPLNVEVRLNDSVVGTFQPGAAWAVHDIVLPARLFAPGPSLVELRFDHTARPSQHEPGSTDARELALRVDRITVAR